MISYHCSRHILLKAPLKSIMLIVILITAVAKLFAWAAFIASLLRLAPTTSLTLISDFRCFPRYLLRVPPDSWPSFWFYFSPPHTIIGDRVRSSGTVIFGIDTPPAILYWDDTTLDDYYASIHARGSSRHLLLHTPSYSACSLRENDTAITLLIYHHFPIPKLPALWLLFGFSSLASGFGDLISVSLMMRGVALLFSNAVWVIGYVW